MSADEGFVMLETPIFDHDDPSEPPPTEYPGAGVSAWPQYPQAVQQQMMVVSQPVGPPGVWDCSQVPMIMMSSGADAQTVGAQMMWSFQQQQAWQPEPWQQANEPTPTVEAPAVTPAPTPAPTLAPTPAPAPKAEEQMSQSQSSPRLHANDSTKQDPRSRSQTRSGMTGIAGEARQRAEQAKDAQWPRLTIEACQAAMAKSEVQVRTPIDSVWRDPAPAPAGKAPSLEKRARPAAAAPVPQATATRPAPAVPAVPAVPAMSVVPAAAPRKVATREVAVQCELLSAASKATDAQPGLCKHCGDTLEKDAHRSIAEITSVANQPAPWGPANDWAWDHDAKIDDTDDWREYTSLGAAEEVQARQLPPAPLIRAPLPPQLEVSLSSKADKDQSPATQGDSSSSTSCPADSESSPSEREASPRPSSTCSPEECSTTCLAPCAPEAKAAGVLPSPPTLATTKVLAANRETLAKTKPPQEMKQSRVKETTPTIAVQRQQPPPGTAAGTSTASAKSKRAQPPSQKEGKKPTSKVGCRLFKLRLKSVVAGLVATLALLVAQGGFEFNTLRMTSSEFDGEPVSEEVSLVEMERAKAAAKQVKNDVKAARQRVMDKEWKPLQARFDEAYRAARKQRKSDEWWVHQYEQMLQERQARFLRV